MRRVRVSGAVLVALVAAVVVVVVVVVVLVATSGPSSHGDVTFRASTGEAVAGPTAWCDVAVTECENDADAVVSLGVPPGTGLAVTVPGEVAATPWQVAFSFRDATGTVLDGRSPVFAPHARTQFTLVLPDPTGRLVSAEVQQYGARLAVTPEGPGFSTRSTWVLQQR